MIENKIFVKFRLCKWVITKENAQNNIIRGRKYE